MKSSDLTITDGALAGLKLPSRTSLENVQQNQLAVDGTDLVKRDANSWTTQVVLGETPLYAFSTHTFTTNKQREAIPSLAELRTLYSGQAWVNDTSLFNTSGGIQLWTVPSTATYRIKVVSPSVDVYQPGAEVQFDVALTKGDVLKILCGQIGTSVHGTGASFCQSTALGLLAVAGGHGGMYRVSSPYPISAPNTNIDFAISNNGGTSSAVTVSPNGSAAAAGGSGWGTPCSTASSGSASVIPGTSLGAGGTPGQGHSPSYGTRSYGGLGGGGGGGTGGNNQFRCLGGGGGYQGGGAVNVTSATNTAAGAGSCFCSKNAAVSNRSAQLYTATNLFGYVSVTKLA